MLCSSIFPAPSGAQAKEPAEEGIRNLRCKASENRDWGVLAPAGYGSSGNQLVKDSRVSSVSKKLRTPLARQGESWSLGDQDVKTKTRFCSTDVVVNGF